MYELRLCVTKWCNFKCSYCRPGGEGVFNENPVMTIDEIESCINFMAQSGFDSVRITGGEPFLRVDLIDIINRIGNIEGITNVSMVTNASLITSELIEKLSQSKLNSITVSLDTMDRKEFEEIVHADCFDKVIENIIALSKTMIRTRINMVVTSKNVNMIPEVRKLCSEYSVDFKLLDLNNNGMDDWQEEYVDFSSLYKKLKKDCVEEEIQYVKGQTGTPMSILKYDNYAIILKDSKKGTCYVEKCKECNYYPCQTGVSSPIITHDGYLKFCNLGNLSHFNLLEVANKVTEYIQFDKEFKSMHFKNEWNYRKEESCAK